MDSVKAVGRLLNVVKPASEEALVGYGVAVGAAFLAEEGVTAKQVRDIIAESSHHVPANVGARLFGLLDSKLVTHRGEGASRTWRLTPDGQGKFDHILHGKTDVPVDQRYIDPGKLPDDFYVLLVQQLNRAYQAGLYVVVPILARKLLENLVIDLLRKRYGMNDVSIWFDKNKGRFLDFSALIDALATHVADFKPFSGSIDKAFVKKIDLFRESGNAGAHSIEVLTTKQDVDKVKADLQWVVQIMIRALDQMK